MFEAGDNNSTYQADDDILLKRGPASSSGVTVITNSTSNNNLEYNSDGSTNEGGGTARFAICDSRGGEHGYQIDVPPVGRPSFNAATSGSPVNCTSPS